MKIKTGYGFKLYQARSNKGLSQQELASKIGVSRTSLNYWETNKFIPSRGNLNKLSEILEKPVSYFFEETIDNSFNRGIINKGDNKDSKVTNSVFNSGEQKSTKEKTIKENVDELLELQKELQRLQKAGMMTKEEVEDKINKKKEEILGGI